ncbi:aminotransferase class I/II-fold pyridoxal phosphate-dependent enzyme [Actinoplanes oblitus]|uniref:cysteine-S-conjugate beta-lyase n=1 Tax=Actinoplanes oblitus TaxID=3040509 RepID=A0ABY8WPG8_9ACTN|nr:aminotransferase class I/II-fold pyridoxal phosphate-dependent enzyme [Actinoplanes oblitus]WIM99799.1 aminotransferase class I/II-fold pyridoxal phosphate-dependent enzyme [Actinoplanes oblitus]
MLDDLDLASLRRRPGVKWADATAAGALPAWVADMDFPVAEPIQAALVDAVRTDLGYPFWDDRPERNPLGEAFAARMAGRYGFTPAPEHVRVYTEVIQALQAILHVATAPGDSVLMHVPAYSPFLATLTAMGRRLVPVPLADTAAGWSFDADRMAADVARTGSRTLILVNPQNPTGRVFTRAELTAVAEIANRYDLLVIADEVHADLTYDPHRHLPVAALAPEIAARTVTLQSASKAFNLAGLRCCVAHVGHAGVRSALDTLPSLLLGQPGNLGVLGTLAAWQHGDAWLTEVRALLDRNRCLVAAGLPAGVGYHLPEASYLAWLNFRALGLGPDPAAHFLERAGVMLSRGPEFGPPGTGFARLNFATGRAVLDDILGRLRTACPTPSEPGR